MQATRRQEGAVLVEFALVLLPLLMLIFGFLQFGIALNAKIDATHLTAEGARYIAVNQNPGTSESPATSMQNYIRGRADTDYLKIATVCIEYPTNPATSTSRQGRRSRPRHDGTHLRDHPVRRPPAHAARSRSAT